MMMVKNSKANGPVSLLPNERDLHEAPLISTQALLKLWPGAIAMSLTRWKQEKGMPIPVAHGKYNLLQVVRWLWDWKVNLEATVERLEREGKSSGPRADRMEAIKLERMEMDLAQEKKTLVSKDEYEEAEAIRIQVAISILSSIPDRLIALGLIPDSARTPIKDLIGEAVDSIQQRILEGEPVE